MKTSDARLIAIRMFAVFAFVALEGALVVAAAAAIPAEAENAFLFGFSVQRLALMALIAVPSVAALAVALYGLLRPPRAEWFYNWALSDKGSCFLGRAGCLAALLFGTAALMTSAWFGRLGAYYVRLRPLLAWVALLGLDAWALSLAPGWQARKRRFRQALQTHKGVLVSGAIGIGVFLIAWLLIALTGLGVTPDSMFWNEAGVPILGIQVLACLVAVYAAGRLLSRPASWRVDLLLVVGVWLLAFLLWRATPAQHSYFAPDPLPPNNVVYPYSDAAVYDISAQYVLMGRGIGTVFFQDKPLYVLFLAVVRAIAGQSYDAAIGLQIAFLAFLPVGMYFLGKAMANRPAGLLLALLAVFQQRNSLAATPLIQVSNAKLFLTEYPLAMVLVFASLAAFIWLRSPLNRPYRIVLSAGLFGLAVLIRPNAFLTVFFFGLFLILVFWGKWKHFLTNTVIFGVAFLLVVLPWSTYIQPGSDEPYLLAKLRGIWNTRYTPSPQSQIEVPSVAGGSIKLASLASATPVVVKDGQAEGMSSPLQFIPAHFVHNEIMALLALPDTFSLKTVYETVQAPQWSAISSWYGDLPAGSVLLLVVNLALIAVGIGYSWQRWRFAGLVPAVVQVSYYLANGISRNSGARYLVPADWVLLLYYGLGLLLVVTWLAALLAPANWLAEPLSVNQTEASSKSSPIGRSWWKAGGLAAVFLAIGLLLSMIGKMIPDYPLPQGNTAALETLAKNGMLQMDDQQMSAFLANDTAIARIGRGLYPRFYWKDAGEPGPETFPLTARNYGRLTLSLLSADGWYTAVLPYYNYATAPIPDAADVAVVGCKTGDGTTIDAFLVAILSDPPQVYQRYPDAPIACPAPAPAPVSP